MSGENSALDETLYFSDPSWSLTDDNDPPHWDTEQNPLHRSGFGGFSCFQRTFAAKTPYSSYYEPQRGYKESHSWFYLAHALLSVFDLNSNYFMLQEGGLCKDPNRSIFWNTVRILLGDKDIATGKPFNFCTPSLWFFSLIHNLVKLCTEFVLKFIAESFCFLKDSLKEAAGNGSFHQMFPPLMLIYGGLRGLQLLFSGLHLVVRALVSPFESAHAAAHSGYSDRVNGLLETLSISTLAFIGSPFLILYNFENIQRTWQGIKDDILSAVSNLSFGNSPSVTPTP